MNKADIIYPADLNMKDECGCCDSGNACPAPPPYPFPAPNTGSYPFPCPPFPHPHCPPPPPFLPPYPPYCPPCPCPDPSEVVPEEEIGKTEKEICKLSKKVAAINKMLENLDKKKKDVIIKIGGVSYNFGNIELEDIKDWKEVADLDEDKKNYAAVVKKILEEERSLIQEQIKELATKLDQDAEAIALNVYKTVASDLSGD